MTVYYPYFRSKTYECKAVANAAHVMAKNGKITPIFEPVKVNSSPLISRAAKFQAAGLRVAVVLNPQVGELVGSVSAPANILASMRAAGGQVSKGWIVDQLTSLSDVTALAGDALPIVFVHRGVPTDPHVTAALVAFPSAEHLFHEGTTSVVHIQGFPPANRALLRDGFQAQVRNSAYPPQSFFSDLHLTYKGAGYSGFGDFQIVGTDYSLGGGPAYAVAIHVTEDAGTMIICNHFISTTNLTVANPGGKFAEAVKALAQYVAAHPGKIDQSTACQEFLAHYQSGHFPGLGDVKRLSIQHHLELMSTIV
ncbi:sce7725 family protein [Myxococcus sp. CA040A]|uniref:sce7725 family protein n=1 Tax=Myxococcus sp. CA040A TaxID=2741738 RepID=UPI00157B9C61|nr:sce7725 family protein [Myxococcus sp. CA040A]NTX06623.1 sce7725 family protein [Myxococcus sp. CA040A]